MKKAKFLVGLIFLLSCKKPTDPASEKKFDRAVFLNAYATEFIEPGFKSALTEIVSLESQILDLNSSNDLSTIRQQWEKAYLAYLRVSLYNFGPAEEQVLRKSLVEEVATFPVNTAVILQKINSGVFSFEDFQRDSRGFLAIEYLLFNDAIVKNDKWHAYLKETTTDVKERIEDVSLAWASYSLEFIGNDGTSAGSSTSIMYNEFLKSFEALKNFKLGLPLGLRPGQTQAIPENIEAPNSQLNLLLLKQHFQTLKTFWIGSSGKGFKAYLLTVEGGEVLVNSTEQQMNEVEAVFDGLNEADFDKTQLDGNLGLIKLHTELQKLTRFFKSEMSSLLGIAITFSSGDGD
jgi:uncharacterized protein